MKNYKDKITAVIILYNVTDVIFECLKNLKNIQIIIADNGDNNPDTIKEIKKNKNIVKYFRFKKNIGFGRACNFCLRYVETDFTLLINPDALIKEKLISKYIEKTIPINQSKSTDINVLLNRVKTNQKNESRKKLYFSAAASTGLFLFALIIF